MSLNLYSQSFVQREVSRRDRGSRFEVRTWNHQEMTVMLETKRVNTLEEVG